MKRIIGLLISLTIIIVSAYCDQNCIPFENNHISNNQKKQEKNKIKYVDLLKETTKNSYSNKYMEEQNRNKINKKNSSNTNLKLKYDIKESVQSLKASKKFNNKKGKNNSMGKAIKSDSHSKILEGKNHKKKTRNL